MFRITHDRKTRLQSCVAARNEILNICAISIVMKSHTECTLVLQPDGAMVDGHVCQLRAAVARGGGRPLIRKLDIVPDRHLETLGQRYGNDVLLVRRAIMRDEWC